MSYKKIFSKKVFVKLIEKGHILLRTEPNKNKHWLSVFVFQMDNTLLNDLTEITKR